MSDSKSEVIPYKERNVEAEDDHIARVNEEGREIYGDYQRRLAEDEEFAALGPQDRYEFYMKSRYAFALANPIILRYIACFGMFSEKANWLYFKQCYQRPIKTDADYCERQADFIMYLYKMCTPTRGDALKRLHEEARVALLAELEERARDTAEQQAKRQAHKESVLAARKDALKKLVAGGQLAQLATDLAN